MIKSTWTDLAGRPARQKGTPGNQHTRIVAPEWAHCSADRFEELRYEAWFLRTTLAEMQGEWNYPVGEIPEAQ